MGGFTAALQKFGIGRLAAVLGVAAGVAAVLVAVMLRVGQAPDALLYSNLDLKEAGEITSALDQAGIKYSSKGDGSTIMVNRDQVGEARLMLAGKGLVTSGSVGYEIFDNQSVLGQTEFQQQLNEQRALQGELSRTIMSMRGITAARVHITMPRREMFQAAATRPAVRAIWWPRFLQVAEWFVPWETARRARILTTFVELKGELSLPLLTRDFTLSGIADRIDLFTDGTLAILDYKTGKAPTAKQTDAKFSVQLPLEAAMAARGAFENQKDGSTGPVAAQTSELAYVELKGGREPGKVVSATGKDKDAMTTGEDALEHTHALLTLFEDEETPYISRPRPQFLSYDGPFDHLARVKEWQTVSDTE